MEMGDLKPERPLDAGVEEAVPEPPGVEGAHVLADQARERLRASGFTDEQIDEWADAYIAESESGDLRGFLAWISAAERRHGDLPE